MQAPLLIDISRLVGRAARGRLPTGIDRVCLQWIARYGHRARAVVQRPGWRRIAGEHASRALFDLLRAPGPDFRLRFCSIVARACIPPWPSQAVRGQVYLHAGQSGLDDPGTVAWIARRGVRPVFMVHDLIPLTHPECCRHGEADRHASRLESMLAVGAGLVANSADTLDQLQAYVRKQGGRMPPAVAAPLGVDSNGGDRKVIARECVRPRAEPYFVVLGTIEPRKNHMLLLRVWREIVAVLGARAPHLHIVGQRGWDWEPVVAALASDPALRAHVHELGACSDAEVARQLAHAQALLFPSVAEGYGLPLVEALATGTPVIASDLPVFREIAGEVPDYLAPNDFHGWRRAVCDYIAPVSARRDAQRVRIASYTPPGWDRHFAQVDALLERLA